MRSSVCSANKAAAAGGDSHDMDGDHDPDDGDNDNAKMKNVHQFTKINMMWSLQCGRTPQESEMRSNDRLCHQHDDLYSKLDHLWKRN